MSLFSSDEPVAVPAPTAQPLAEPHPEPADVPELVTALAVGKVNAHRRQRPERKHHLADMLAVDASGGDPWRGPIFAPKLVAMSTAGTPKSTLTRPLQCTPFTTGRSQ